MNELKDFLERLEREGNVRSLLPVRNEGRWMVSAGGDFMLNLASNDYLGIGTDQKLRDEFWETCPKELRVMGASSSRLLTGNYPIFARLETDLAARMKHEASLVFNSGYHANIGILPAISDSRTLILADKLVHASLIDGMRLSAARVIRFRHNDYDQLERLVGENKTSYHRIIIVVESVYSMDGDEADLCRLAALRRCTRGVWLYVDEAHAFGVRGPGGLGCAEASGCMEDIDFLVGTFGKAVASAGAFVACSKLIRDYLINRMRPFIFTTALPPVCLAWTMFIVERFENFAGRRKFLSQISARFRKGLKDCGYNCSPDGHIVPLIIGDGRRAVEVAKRLQAAGFYALPVRPPAVPEGTSRIRFSLTSGLSTDEIDRLLNVLPSYIR